MVICKFCHQYLSSSDLLLFNMVAMMLCTPIPVLFVMVNCKVQSSFSLTCTDVLYQQIFASVHSLLLEKSFPGKKNKALNKLAVACVTVWALSVDWSIDDVTYDVT